MLKNNEIAKELFIKYRGNHFQMERNGEYEFYKSFNISKEQEESWIKEYHKSLILKLEDENTVSIFMSQIGELSDSIIRFKDIDSFKRIIDIVLVKSNILDSFSRLRVAEEILKIVDVFSKHDKKNDNVLSNAREVSLNILNNIIEEPITVDSSYKNIGYLKDAINDENIINRVKGLLQIYNKMVKS